MLSRPIAGWSDFRFAGVNANASYLEDIPITWLDTLSYYYAGDCTMQNFVLAIDEEGSEVYLVFLDGTLNYIICRNDQVKLIETEVHVDDFAIELCMDIERNIDTWTNEWTPLPHDDEVDQTFYRKKHILDQIEDIRFRIERGAHERKEEKEET